MAIKLGQKMGKPITHAENHTYYPEITIPKKKVPGHKVGKTYRGHVELHACNEDENNMRYEVHNLDFAKSPAKDVGEAVDNAAEEAQEEKDEGSEGEGY